MEAVRKFSELFEVIGYAEENEKWTMPLRNGGKVYGELSIMYEGRLPE